MSDMASDKKAIVIGAGFGGLALAIRLQSAGVQTTVLEARDKAGGRGYHWKQEGFTFDAGPTVVTDPPCLEELWALSGQKIADDVDLMPVMPFYRLDWPDGSHFDYSNDEESLLDTLRKSLGIDNDQHSSLEQEIQLEIYLEAIVEGWKDGAITPEDSEKLDVLREKFSISAEEHLRLEKQVRREILKQRA